MIRQQTLLRKLALSGSGNVCLRNLQYPRFASNKTSSGSAKSTEAQQHEQKAEKLAQNAEEKKENLKKTMSQLDEELMRKLEGISGEGGEAGLELEGGKPVSMKRGVRENMFRYI